MNMNPQTLIPRSPVVVVMGHIDHGKSTLLDYIRKTRVVDTEAGGITQRISAYEILHETEGTKRRITFLDTPGHEAFQTMRQRGSAVADVAILVVSAEDGVKTQTMEAYGSITMNQLPFVVAISKIDKPNANIERVKTSLLENGIYLEGMGGDVPFVPISSKTGDGIDDLLDLILLAADLRELYGDPNLLAEGVVIESHRDAKKGISATLIIKNGSLKQGQYLVAGEAFAPTRILEDFGGHPISDATFSSPVIVVGFSDVAKPGDVFFAVSTKREAEEAVRLAKQRAVRTSSTESLSSDEEPEKIFIPITIKADTQGCIDAIEHELKKIDTGKAEIHVVSRGVGTITENDVQGLTGGRGIAIGFNVGIDGAALELAKRLGVETKSFDIIYQLGEWLSKAIELRRPKERVIEVIGLAKVARIFSQSKDSITIGGKMVSGTFSTGDKLRIMRSDEEIGNGIVESMQQSRATVKTVSDGEFGMQVLTHTPILGGDRIETITIVER